MDTEKNLSVAFLDSNKVHLKHNENGFLILELNGETKGRINLKRCYPFSLPDEYICILDTEDREIGIIRDLKLLDKASSSVYSPSRYPKISL